MSSRLAEQIWATSPSGWVVAERPGRLRATGMIGAQKGVAFRRHPAAIRGDCRTPPTPEIETGGPKPRNPLQKKWLAICDWFLPGSPGSPGSPGCRCPMLKKPIPHLGNILYIPKCQISVLAGQGRWGLSLRKMPTISSGSITYFWISRRSLALVQKALVHFLPWCTHDSIYQKSSLVSRRDTGSSFSFVGKE